jgi:hypothetical protein
LERLGRKGLERLAERGFRGVHDGELLGGRGALARERGLEARLAGAGGGTFRGRTCEVGLECRDARRALLEPRGEVGGADFGRTMAGVDEGEGARLADAGDGAATTMPTTNPRSPTANGKSGVFITATDSRTAIREESTQTVNRWRVVGIARIPFPSRRRFG